MRPWKEPSTGKEAAPEKKTEPARGSQGPGAGRVTRSKADYMKEAANSPSFKVMREDIKRMGRELRSLGVNIEDRLVEDEPAPQEPEPDKVSLAMCTVMLEKLGMEFEDVLPDLAYRAMEVDPTKIDPSRYKDMFENPKLFKDAWDHPDPFQKDKWRAAIKKEFDKMELNKIWRKVKRETIPKGRRCVKYKWVF